MVSAAGIGVETFWNNLLKGVNNAAKVSAFDAKDMASQGTPAYTLLLLHVYIACREHTQAVDGGRYCSSAHWECVCGSAKGAQYEAVCALPVDLSSNTVLESFFHCLFCGLCSCRLSPVAYEISSDAFDPKQYFREPKDAKRNDRYTQFAVAASKFAMEDAGTLQRKTNKLTQ